MSRSLPEEEVGRLYRDHFAALFRTAARLIGGDAAEDIVHEAFEALIRAVRKGLVDADLDPRAYLFRTVINRAINLLRKRSNRQKAEQAAAQSEGVDDPDPTTRLTLALAMAQLPKDQRLLLFLRYYTDLDMSEIAAILGTTPNTASQRLRRARQALAEQLDSVPPAQDEVSS